MAKASQFLDYVVSQAKQLRKTIIFDEVNDERIMNAVKKILEERIAKVMLVNEEDILMKKIKEYFLNSFVDSGDLILRPMNNKDEFASKLYELRKGKLNSVEDAKELMNDSIYYATMLMYNGEADGLISGANHSTAHTIRPALQFIKTKKPLHTVSGFFFMLMPDERIFGFADCAVLPEPNSQQLAEIAVASAETFSKFGFDPRVALLSFSTKGSAKHEAVDKVVKALDIAKEISKTIFPGLKIDGELQLDAAIVPEVAKKKVKVESDVAGKANVLIFPDLNSGNIGYKLVQRLGNAKAIGPVLQGLKKPVNDLSRGCSVDDIFYLAAITSLQS